MNFLLRKIIFWGSVLAIYALMVVVVMRLLLVPESELAKSLSLDASANLEQHHDVMALIEKIGQPGELSGLLLPLGPGDGQLPGASAVWRDFQRGYQHDPMDRDSDGFDGLQAVAKVSEFSAAAVSELFLSEEALQVFRRGPFLYLRNAREQVQVVDCSAPDAPRLAAVLPYDKVVSMAMQGGIAYLLLERPGAPTNLLVVVDLKDAGPRELARLQVSGNAFSVFLVNSQLVVYSSQRGLLGQQQVALYDVANSRQLRLLGSAESPNLGRDCLQYGNYVLVPESSGGLSVYDFSQPLEPERVAFLDTPILERLASHGSMLFASGLGGQLYSIDLQLPSQPVVSTVVEALNHTAYFLEHGGYSYFFTPNGYLHVVDLSLADLQLPSATSAMIAGELVAPSPSGLMLLEPPLAPLHPGISGRVPWPEALQVVDHLTWQDTLVVLDVEGRLSFFRQTEGSSPVFVHALQLAAPPRWLAASAEYLYVGGDGFLHVLAEDGDDTAALLSQIDLPVKKSWDGLVLQDVLYVAAGSDGLLAYSIRRPDAPVAASTWLAPWHLRSEVDVRSLAAAEEDRLLFTAGTAGLFSGRMEADGEFRLEGAFRFASAALAVAAYDGLALVSTVEEICVLDVRDRRSLQNLGKIAFPEVERFVIAAPDQLAVYRAAQGWSLLPMPHFLTPDAENLPAKKDLTSNPASDAYRLNLFNDRDVESVSGLFHLPGRLLNQPASGGALVR